MRHDNHTPKDFAEFSLHKAGECLHDAQAHLANAGFDAAANRSYFCIFHAMRTIQALDRFDSKRHSGVIAAFRKDYIKTGVFPKEFSRIIGDAFEVCTKSDYEAFYLVSKADVAAQVENAERFLEVVEKYVSERIKNP
jgi:uncharacterized protein (UPF0332 family)